MLLDVKTKDFYFQNKDIANCVVVKSTGPFAIIFIGHILRHFLKNLKI